MPGDPPDALALALRTGLPIYATGDALAHAEPLLAGPGVTDGDVGAWLQRVKPDDFTVGGGEAE